MMLSKAKIKLVQSLKDKKHRIAEGLFVVEGNKAVAELLGSKIQVKTLFATAEWLNENSHLVNKIEVIETEADELHKVSFAVKTRDAVALAVLPEKNTALPAPSDQLVLALDTVQDPGNMGTIIRIADWYGISHIVCSPGCADIYSPKVIQSAMGSFLRVTVTEHDLPGYFATLKNVAVYGALMEGKSIYDEQITSNGVLLIGNEGKGISPSLMKYITNPVTIPRRGQAESLNAGVATAIICDAWARGNR